MSPELRTHRLRLDAFTTDDAAELHRVDPYLGPTEADLAAVVGGDHH